MYECKWIQLEVHSALEAKGLTAAFSRALADSLISANVVAGFYHDHWIAVARVEAELLMAPANLQLSQANGDR